MPGNPSKISQFLQELRRRRVIHVIIVYASAAFVIIELVNNVTEPLKLPGWTPTLAIIILAIGFPLAIIFSWIFDMTPRGLEKTSSAREFVSTGKTSGSKGWKIATYLSVAIIAVLVIINIAGKGTRSKFNESIEKSIAVLPFRNDSDDKENEYFCNGIMEEVLINLQSIKDFKVPGRTSVEQYRGVAQSIPDIARELGVNYVVETSGQKYGNTFVLRVQLIEGSSGMHLWAKQFRQEIRTIEDIVNIQSQIAKAIASELQTVISPEELQIIERLPTSNLTAYDLYRRAEENLLQYRLIGANWKSLTDAENLYREAILNDPDFALAYVGLAKVTLSRDYLSNAYFSENYLDSVKIWADRALELDHQLAEAYLIRGEYFRLLPDTLMALNEYNKVLSLNPNSWEAYRGLGVLYVNQNHIESIKNLLKAYSLYHGPEVTQLLNSLSVAFAFAGFYENSRNYAEIALELGGDSAIYFNTLAMNENWQGHYRQSIIYCLEGLKHDSANVDLLDRLAYDYMFVGDNIKALECYKKVENFRKREEYTVELNDLHRIGYTYSRNGLVKEAADYMQRQEDVLLQSIELERPQAQSLYAYYDLAGVYAFRGEKAKALKNLEIFNRRKKESGWMVTLIQDDPLFDSIREEPEFQQIVSDVKAKYFLDYNEVRTWLMDQGLLE
jgi:TolB-like protein/Tfp pilus assembly protein PilF